MAIDDLKFKTVAVFGGSYGGNRAAQLLAAGLPHGWRVVLVDRNSHFNHVYNFPRYAVLPGHEYKGFIPYNNLFNNPSDPVSSSHPHQRVHGTITALHPHHITYTPHSSASSQTDASPVGERTLHFDYAIYALGSHLPSPIDLWGFRDSEFSSGAEKLGCSDAERDSKCKHPVRPYRGMKQDSIHLLRTRQRKIEAAHQVLVAGGGALGIQFASDIAAIYPFKSVTLLHSRSRLLPRFDEALGDEVYQGLQELGVHVILDERLDMSSFDSDGINKSGKQKSMSVRTSKGREIKADLVLVCTGQIPNTSLIRTMDSRTINPKNGLVQVSRTMQILSHREHAPEDGHPDGCTRSTSPTLCGTAPPSPTNTLVELDSIQPMSPKDILVKLDVGASGHDHTYMYPHLFAIGDAADAFGACKAGHTAYYQGEVAAQNVLKLINGAERTGARSPTKGEAEGSLGLEEYTPGRPMIKVTLGLRKVAFQVEDVVDTKDDDTEDLGAAVVWAAYGYKDIDDEGMQV